MKAAELAARQELPAIAARYREDRLGGGGRLLGHRALDRRTSCARTASPSEGITREGLERLRERC